MGIKLEFNGIQEGCKQEPLMGTSFLIYSINQTFGISKLEKIIEGLKVWKIVIPTGYVEFTEALELDNKTIFGLTLKYRDLNPMTETQLVANLESIYESFSLFLNQRVEDLDK
jgi:hypothetical protein